MTIRPTIDTVLIDIDGLAADFVRAAFKWFREPCDYDSVTWDFYSKWKSRVTDGAMSYNEFRFSLGLPKFWATLPVLDSGKLFVEHMLAKQEAGEIERVAFCSTLMDTPGCHIGRLEWLREHFPGVPAIFTDKKGTLGRPGSLLVDDRPENLEAFAAAGGETFCWSQPWNLAYRQSLACKTAEAA